MGGGFMGRMKDLRGKNVEEMPTLLYRSVRSFSARDKCLTLLLATLLAGIGIALPVLCCLRVDDAISWPWTSTLTPLWTLDIIYGIFLLSTLCESDGRLGRLYALFKAVLLLAAQVSLALKLDDALSWSLLRVFAPYFVYGGLNLLEALVGGVLGYQMLAMDSVGAGVSHTEGIEAESRLLVRAVVRKAVLTLFRLAQVLLICLKVDGRLDGASWWMVLLPVWIHIGYFFSYPVNKYMRSAAKYPLLDATCTTLVIAVLVSPFFLLALRLEGATFSSITVLLPWLILAGLSFFFLCCTVAVAGNPKLERGSVQTNKQHARTPRYRADYVAVDMD